MSSSKKSPLNKRVWRGDFMNDGYTSRLGDAVSQRGGVPGGQESSHSTHPAPGHRWHWRSAPPPGGEQNTPRGPGEQKACDCCHSTQDTTVTINELDLHKKPKALECRLVGWPRDTTLGWMMGEMTRLGSPAHSAGEFTQHKGPGEEQYISF